MNYLTKITVFFLVVQGVNAQIVPTKLADFYMPGSQPLESGSLAKPTNCSCHDFNGGFIFDKWQGSMMAHALVDPLFRATLTVAQQDADSSGDLCLRCHTPTGWLEGRSIPTDGSHTTSDDETSVNCFFCHRILYPAEIGTNPYPLDPVYTSDTYLIDSTYLWTISDHIPPASANGMYVVDDLDKFRRGPYTDANSNKHSPIYSPFHRQSDLCGTCHDVSNPVYSRDQYDIYTLNAVGDTTPDFNPYTLFPVERTYSEWKNSAFNNPLGIGGTPFGGSKSTVSTCQDCHMPDVTGTATSNSVERIDLPYHDLTGGNTFIPTVLTTMTAAVRDDGIARATFMLQNAVTMTVDAMYHTITVKVTNQTGHKLPSGYPEGRRMWLNVKAFNADGDSIFESGHYDPETGVLTHDTQAKIYEIKPGLSHTIAGITGLEPGPSFHFVLNDTVFKDNRIPPLGFTNANFQAIQSPPVSYSYPDGQNWDETEYTLDAIPDSVSVTLYYQTTSREYVEFLRSENYTDSLGKDMYDLWDQNGKSVPVVMAQVILQGPDISLAVGLSNFRVQIKDGCPLLTWQTFSEIDNLGFMIVRSDESTMNFREISSYRYNDDLLGLGSSSSGRVYQYADRDTSLKPGRTYYYQLYDVDNNGHKGVHGPVAVVFNPEDTGMAGDFILYHNYPNPFNSGTTIRFSLREKQPVAVRIYDMNGRLVRNFPEYLYYPGPNKVYWDARDNYGRSVSSGLYLYEVAARNKVTRDKMLMVK